MMPFKRFFTRQPKSQLAATFLKHPKQRGIALFLIAGLFFMFASPIGRTPSVPHVVAPPSIELPPEDAPVVSEIFDPFPFPEALTPQVDFWRKIFTQYTTMQAVIHDAWYVNVIYEVVNINDPVYGSEKEGWKAVSAAREKYVKILESLADHWGDMEKMTETEQQVYALFKDIPESSHFKKADAKDRVRHQVGQADRFQAGIIRVGQYLPAMKQIFIDAGLPEKLVYLPLIESAFNPEVKSFVGAAGMWQFMPATGREFRLAVSPTVDERRDPLRSTRAAAELLAHNYKVTQSWPMAITAYNFGLQGIKNAAKAVQTEDIGVIVEQYDGPRFGFASRNFYVEFLAAVDVCLQYKQYYGDIEMNAPVALAQVKLPDYVSAATLEKYTKLSKADLQKLNPALHSSLFGRQAFLPRGHQLNIPEDRKAAFEARYAAIPQSLKFRYMPVKAVYVVRKGQALSTIAKLHHVSLKSLMAANNIKNAKKIRPGQRLKIPGGYVPTEESGKETIVVAAAQPKKEASRKEGLKKDENTGTRQTPPAARRHRIEKGQTLSAIANMHGTTIRAIMDANNLKSSQKIRVGQTLKIPSAPQLVAKTKTPAPSKKSGKNTKTRTEHLVKKGQTLDTIAKIHKTSAKAIARANAIKNPRQIRPGQKLIIPEG